MSDGIFNATGGVCEDAEDIRRSYGRMGNPREPC